MSAVSSGGLDLRQPIDTGLAGLERQRHCQHGGVRYRFPTDGSEPYECAKCGYRFSWDAIEAFNVSKGGKPGAFDGGRAELLKWGTQKDNADAKAGVQS